MFVSQHLPFSPGPPMGLKRGACAAAALRDSQILVLGGATGHTAHDATEVLMLSDSNKMSVAPGPRLRARRREPATIRLDGGRFMVIGGHDGSEYLNSTEVLSLKTNEFVPGCRRGTRRTSTLACWPSTTPAALASAASRSRRAVPAAPSRSPCPRNGLCWCVCVCVCVCLPPLFFPPSVLVGAPLRGRGTVALLGHWHLAQQGQVPALAGPSFPSHSFSFAALPADFLSGPG
ncbi:unnamed protein product [Prorocentrum cordatum]|uniref:Uncharacterized protein n=1 Tax=Prorocentrum cordatum TaxID=2364126 RepID=A0ABN9PYF6_9DINO|nr:unnamed protein product [Polarella glacialis]